MADEKRTDMEQSLPQVQYDATLDQTEEAAPLAMPGEEAPVQKKKVRPRKKHVVRKVVIGLILVVTAYYEYRIFQEIKSLRK